MLVSSHEWFVNLQSGVKDFSSIAVEVEQLETAVLNSTFPTGGSREEQIDHLHTQVEKLAGCVIALEEQAQRIERLTLPIVQQRMKLEISTFQESILSLRRRIDQIPETLSLTEQVRDILKECTTANSSLLSQLQERIISLLNAHPKMPIKLLTSLLEAEQRIQQQTRERELADMRPPSQPNQSLDLATFSPVSHELDSGNKALLNALFPSSAPVPRAPQKPSSKTPSKAVLPASLAPEKPCPGGRRNALAKELTALELPPLTKDNEK